MTRRATACFFSVFPRFPASLVAPCRRCVGGRRIASACAPMHTSPLAFDNNTASTPHNSRTRANNGNAKKRGASVCEAKRRKTKRKRESGGRRSRHARHTNETQNKKEVTYAHKYVDTNNVQTWQAPTQLRHTCARARACNDKRTTMKEGAGRGRRRSDTSTRSSSRSWGR